MLPSLAAQAISPFPNPPTYASEYTNEKILQGAVLPPPAVHSVFTVFGEEYKLEDEIIRSLHSQGIRQLYTSKNDWKAEMKKLNRSAVVAFMDLIEILIRCPDSPERLEKLNDLHTIFINMHHLINEYRPVQARDTIRLMQEQQVEQLDALVTSFKSFIDEGRTALADELLLKDLKLKPVPKPSPTTRIRLVSEEINEASPPMEAADSQPIVDVQMKEDIDTITTSLQRLEACPSIAHLKARQLADLSMLASI